MISHNFNVNNGPHIVKNLPSKHRWTSDSHSRNPDEEYHRESQLLGPSSPRVSQRPGDGQVPVHTNCTEGQYRCCTKKNVQTDPDVAEDPA